jgi:uncharacterized RDD family membrane protein YckC
MPDPIPENPYRAPAAGGAAGRSRPEPLFTGNAGFRVRFAAWLIDLFVFYLGMLGLVISVNYLDLHLPKWNEGFRWIEWFTIIAYYTAMESSSLQATVGKAVLGLKVTDLQGHRLTPTKAFGRSLAKFLSALFFLAGFAMIAIDSRKQGLHDQLADTLVMKTR